MDLQVDEWIDGWIQMDEYQMYRQIDAQIDSWMKGQIPRLALGRIDRSINRQIVGQIDGYVYTQLDVKKD